MTFELASLKMTQKQTAGGLDAASNEVVLTSSYFSTGIVRPDWIELSNIRDVCIPMGKVSLLQPPAWKCSLDSHVFGPSWVFFFFGAVTGFEDLSPLESNVNKNKTTSDLQLQSAPPDILQMFARIPLGWMNTVRLS